MSKESRSQRIAPNSTAVRVALWRALHVELDPPPHLVEDEIGLKLVAPSKGWRKRPDMNGRAVLGYRTGIVIRARFVEDLVTEQYDKGVGQYVILGAGLDTFAQRRPKIAARLQIFEVDLPGAQRWKEQRLIELGYRIPKWLHFVPVDFEINDCWLDRLAADGFNLAGRAVVACTGVSMYLTKEALASTLNQVARLAPGSTLAMTFILPPKAAKRPRRSGRSLRNKKEPPRGKPFISFFSPEEIVALAYKAGLREARHISGTALTERYLSNRVHSLPSPCAEEMLVATT